MKRAYTLCFMLCFSTTLLFSQKQLVKSNDDKRIDSLIIAFKTLQFYNVLNDAKTELINYQKLVIPKIIKLLYSETKLKFDPGEPYIYFANTNFTYQSKASIIPYNVDWLSIRAGWLMEELTFIDFGYSSNMTEKSAPNFSTIVTWDKIATAATLKKDRKIKADKIAAWWQKNKDTWTRLGAIKKLLQSTDVNDVYRALSYIRYGKTKCDGLTKTVYETEIKPIILTISEQTKDEDIKSIITNLLQYGPSDDLISRD